MEDRAWVEGGDGIWICSLSLAIYAGVATRYTCMYLYLPVLIRTQVLNLVL